MSTTPNHTPGPWKAQCATYNQWQIYCPLGHPSTIATLRGSFLDPQACANARLIAAAPEMLDCLRAANEALQVSEVYYALQGQCGTGIIADIQAVISKATQKES